MIRVFKVIRVIRVIKDSIYLNSLITLKTLLKLSQEEKMHRSDAFVRVVIPSQITQIVEGFLCQKKERVRSIVDLCEELAL